MTVKIALVALFLVLSMSRNYPLFRQYDATWGSELIGTSSNSIRRAGCVISSIAMALNGCGKSYNPSTLNTWLKKNRGYANGDLFVWSSVGPLGLRYVDKIQNSKISSALKAD